MDGTQILTLGLGLEAPWILKDQHLDTPCHPIAWTSPSRQNVAAFTLAPSVVKLARPMISPARPGGT